MSTVFIKSELDREYTYHIESDDDFPAVHEENFTQKREVTVYSYSESISSNEDISSGDRTVTVDGNSSASPAFKEMLCEWETDPKGIEATLHQIAALPPKCSRGISSLSFPYI